MASSREEIIDDLQEQIRKVGGRPGDWRVGTAKDACGPFFQNHLVGDAGAGLVYREAFTPIAAQAIRDHFVTDCGLELDCDAVPEPGKIVFVYRKTVPAHPASRKLAA